MKDKQPPPDFNQEWADLISTTRQEEMLRQGLGMDADGWHDVDGESVCPNCGEVHPLNPLMVLTFQFGKGISQDALLDSIAEYMQELLGDGTFRAKMGWDASGTVEAPSKPSAPKPSQADDYARPRYIDYVDRPAAFEKAKAAWRLRMTMLGYDPNDLGNS